MLAKRLLPLLLLLLSVAYFYVYHERMIAAPLRFNDDVVQHYLWLFDTDWGDDFYARTSGAIQPWGFRALLWSLARLFDPLDISRYGPLLIIFSTVWLTVATLRRYLPLIVSVAAAYLVCQYTIETSLGFLARSFSTPLLLLFAYFLLEGNRRGVAGALVLSALFYPPVLLINGLILLLWETVFLVRGWPGNSIQRYIPLVVGGVVALAIAAGQAYLIRHSPDLGPFLDAAELSSRPEFGSRGRVQFTTVMDTSIWRMAQYQLRLFFRWYPAPDFYLFVVGGAFALGALAWRRLGAFTAYLFAFALVTVGLYELARITTPLLFLADRYVIYPWRLGAPLLMALICGSLWSFFPRRWLAYPVAVGLFYLGYIAYRPEQLPVMDMNHYAPIYTHLASLPEDAVVAAPPRLADFIPLLARRSVVLSYESAHALYFHHYDDYVTPRYQDYYAAVNAPVDSLGRVTDFLDTYAADYLIVDKTPPESWLMSSFPPYGAESGISIPDSLGVRFGDLLVVPRKALD